MWLCQGIMPNINSWCLLFVYHICMHIEYVSSIPHNLVFTYMVTRENCSEIKKIQNRNKGGEDEGCRRVSSQYAVGPGLASSNRVGMPSGGTQ